MNCKDYLAKSIITSKDKNMQMHKIHALTYYKYINIQKHHSAINYLVLDNYTLVDVLITFTHK